MACSHCTECKDRDIVQSDATIFRLTAENESLKERVLLQEALIEKFQEQQVSILGTHDAILHWLRRQIGSQVPRTKLIKVLEDGASGELAKKYRSAP